MDNAIYICLKACTTIRGHISKTEHDYIFQAHLTIKREKIFYKHGEKKPKIKKKTEEKAYSWLSKV